MLRSIGLSSLFERASASSPHGYQSTGLCACCKRYGLDSPARRFVCLCSDIEHPFVLNCSDYPVRDYVPDPPNRITASAFFYFHRSSDKLNGDSFFLRQRLWRVCVMERESIEMDVLFVGAGPASLSGA